MKKGTITLYEGISKKDKKPFTALKLTVGDWSKLHFLDSKFEMDYIIKTLKDEQPQENDGNFLDD